MILLNTRFYVSPELTRQQLWSMAVAWWETSDNYDFPKDAVFDFTEDEFQMESTDGTQRVVVNNYDEAFVIQLFTEYSDHQCRYETSFVLNDKAEQPVLQVLQDRLQTELVTDSRSARIYLPNLMREIFWNEYGADDNGLMTGSEPYVFRKADTDLIASIINGDVSLMNPVVYVSVANKTGTPVVDCSMLASELMGQAHIVVESSPVVSRIIRDKTDGRNPFGGHIGVYVPGGSVKSYGVVSKNASMYTIINDVRDMLANTTVPDTYNISKIRQQHLFSKFANSESNEFVQLCESMIADKDKEIDILRQKLNDVSAKAHSLQVKFDVNKQESGEQDCVKIVVDGAELYEGEMADVILRVLKKEYDAMTGDPNLSASRKYDVLGVVLQHNFPHKTDTELSEAVKRAFKDGTVTREGIGYLRSIGFTVDKQSNNHYRIYPDGFDKYYTTIASTPSDKARGFKNCLTDFLNTLYGY